MLRAVNTSNLAPASWKTLGEREEVATCRAPQLQLSCILILIKDQMPGQLKYLVGEHKRVFFYANTMRRGLSYSAAGLPFLKAIGIIIKKKKCSLNSC